MKSPTHYNVLKNRIFTCLTYSFVVLIVFLFLFPIYYLFTMSFKTPLDVVASPPKLMFSPTLKNFHSLFYGENFIKYFINSFLISSVCVILSILMGAPFAYALSRIKARWVGSAMFIVLVLRVIPPVSILVPFYSIFSILKLNDTFLGVILLYMTFSFPLSVWLLKGAFDSLPESIEQAAWIDGCSTFQTFLRVSLPLVAEALAAAAVLIFVNAWNEYLYAMIVTRSKMKTVTVVINTFMRFDETEYGLIAAAGVFISLPIVLFSLLVQKYLVSGMTAGAVKE